MESLPQWQRIARVLEQVCEAGRGHVEIFGDLGFSGLRADRPGYRRLQQAIVNGDISSVIVTAPDRISRSPIELERFLRLCLEHEVTLMVAGETIERIDIAMALE